jgi:hypothetical protein
MEDKWISVDEKLPADGLEVLAFEYSMYHVSFWNGDEWDCYGDITHWMPLPHEPEE